MASIRTILFCVLFQGQAPEGPPRPPESPPAHQKFADRFREAINERKPDLLRSTYAPGLLAITKPEHAAEIVAEFLAAQGKIKKMEETGILGDVAYFKLTTERGAMNLKIYMLSDGPIINYFELKKFPSPIPVPARNSMTLRLPFREEWGVMWGGRNLIDNYHNDTHALNQFAVDFIVVDGNDLRFKGDGQANDDYFAFGKEILAVAPGRVVEVVDGYPDNLPGFSGTLSGGGNTVTIEHANREFSNYIHLKHQSIAVKVGDVVTVGQVIARCGNSGQSPAPHLHFGLVNSENAAFATGFPVFFGDVAVMRDGRVEVMKDYEPKRGDLVSPAATPSPQGPPPK